ncbi:MAG: Universal stress protein family [Labilithrix sp.]|nr:Universal stress protein family [Labilithrix sp.]
MLAFKRILVPTDFSAAADRALDFAIDIATISRARITLFHASWLPPDAFADYGWHANGIDWHADEIATAARKTLDEALARARARYPNTDSGVSFGEPWRAILDFVEEHGIDFVVMGTHGRRGLSHLVLGSVAEKVVRLSPVPVLTVRAEAARETARAAPPLSTPAVAKQT